MLRELGGPAVGAVRAAVGAEWGAMWGPAGVLKWDLVGGQVGP